MSASTLSGNQNQKSFAKAVIQTGLLAGTLDILAAITHAYFQSGTSPERLFQFIASGLFGSEAFSGGMPMVFLGLIMHFLIALSWTLIFFLVYPKLSFLSKNKIVSGIVFGLFVWAMMSFVILPLTSTPKFPFNLGRAMIGAAILILMIGMPVSFLANKYYSNK